MSRIYCDYNATTPLHPRVLAGMVATAERCLGNPSSQHSEGRVARQAVEQARGQVAALIDAHPAEITFTSGGTESNNLALVGAARQVTQTLGRPARIVSSGLEHPSVRATLAALADAGCTVHELPCDQRGGLHVDELARLLKEKPSDLVSLALCNHELGNIYPIAELAAVAHAHGARFHCDAVQAVGRLPVSVRGLGIDLLSLSAHKLCGPKGVGALYVGAKPVAAARVAASPNAAAGTRSRAAALSAVPALPSLADMPPLLWGGPQERGLRPGTENLLGIVGFGEAASLCQSELLPRWQHVAKQRDALERRLLTDVAGARIQGDNSRSAGRAPGTTNAAFAEVEGELLLMNLDLRGIAVSTGAACSSGSVKPSPVLLALGQDEQQARQAIRISLGPYTTPADIERIAAAIADSVMQIRSAK